MPQETSSNERIKPIMLYIFFLTSVKQDDIPDFALELTEEGYCVVPKGKYGLDCPMACRAGSCLSEYVIVC